MRKLDFLVIGAQKAGTTSVYKYLSRHSQIYMPPEKEAAYFCDEMKYKQGWESYLNDFFAEAPQDCLWGKATPQYMCYMRVPERIARCMPHIKLIAILRDPVQRAISHYRMCVRRGIEKRTLNEAVEQLLKSSVLRFCRGLRPKLKNEKDCYIVWGEYGRILNEYLKWFSRNQLLIVFLEDLQWEPVSVYKRICDFLGVDNNQLPRNIGKRYHVGGTSWKYPVLEKLRASQLAKSMWHLVPEKRRRRIMFWYPQWNVKPDTENRIYISDRARKKLQEFYKDDALVIRNITGFVPPWLSSYL